MRDTSEFGWVNHETSFIYKTKGLQFKLKSETLSCSDGRKLVGVEVYICDDPKGKNWRPLRFFSSEFQLPKIKNWVEAFSQRLLARREDSEPSQKQQRANQQKSPGR